VGVGGNGHAEAGRALLLVRIWIAWPPGSQISTALGPYQFTLALRRRQNQLQVGDERRTLLLLISYQSLAKRGETS